MPHPPGTRFHPFEEKHALKTNPETIPKTTPETTPETIFPPIPRRIAPSWESAFTVSTDRESASTFSIYREFTQSMCFMV